MLLKSSGGARGHTPLACCHFKIFKFCGMVPTLCTPILKYVIVFKCTEGQVPVLRIQTFFSILRDISRGCTSRCLHPFW
jgi:hypothetical protein